MGYCPRLLICENDPETAAELTLRLVHAGFWVEHATTTAEALGRLERQSFDLLLMNLILPDQDSLSFCRELRILGIRLPTLITEFDRIHTRAHPDSGFHLSEGRSNDGEPEWVRKAAAQARMIFSIKTSCLRARGYQPRILHLEADPFCAGLVGAALRKGVHLTQVADPGELARAATEDPYDLVALNPAFPRDALLPAFDRLLNQCPHTPILLRCRFPVGTEAADMRSDRQDCGLMEMIQAMVLRSVAIPLCAHA